VQLGVPHAALRRQGIRESRDRACVAAQHRDFQARVVIQMHVKARDGQIVMRVMRIGQPAGQIARRVVVHVTQRGDAGAAGVVGICRSIVSRTMSRSASDRLV